MIIDELAKLLCEAMFSAWHGKTAFLHILGLCSNLKQGAPFGNTDDTMFMVTARILLSAVNHEMTGFDFMNL